MAGLISLGNLRELPQEELESMPVDGLEPDVPELNEPRTDDATGAKIYDQEDGSVIVDLAPESGELPVSTNHDDNLAEFMADGDLAAIAFDIVQGVEDDLASRSDWENTISRGIDMLGVKLEAPSSIVNSEGSVSNVHHQMLLETIIRYQANFVGEMLPASGPVKVEDTATSTRDAGARLPNFPVMRTRDERAEAFEKDFNQYLTVDAEEFYPDTDRMAFSQAFTGNGFKKQFMCPIRRRPVSESIPAQDLIISNDATSIATAGRVTHRFRMSQSTLKRMQWLGVYRKVDLSAPQGLPDTINDAIKTSEGITTSNRPEDTQYTFYETYVDLDLKGFEHKDENGEETGLPLPYVVTVEAESQTIVAIRRNWEENDPNYTKDIMIVHYPLIPGLGFYAYGFLHIMGNTERAITGLERLVIDAGMLANFPGGIIAKGGAKQATSNIVVGPGQFKEVDTGGKPINDVVSRMPYKEPGQVLLATIQYLEQAGLRMGGAAQVQVGEGRADVPVGTMLAAIEQMAKPVSAIHKRNHSAQRREFLNLKKLFLKDPSALSRLSDNPARIWQSAAEIADIRLVPSSDPNIPSHTHRLMMATALVQMLMQDKGKTLNQREVLERVLGIMGVNNIDSLFNPPSAPKPSLRDMAAAQQLKLKAKDLQIKETDQKRRASDAILEHDLKMKEMESRNRDREQERQSREKIEAMELLEQRIRSANDPTRP